MKPKAFFPLALLPNVLSRFASETADAMGCDPAFVAVPMFAACGAAIGSTRAIQPKIGWCEFPIIWVCTVAPSGSLKTPGFEAAIEPLRRRQTEFFREHEAECAVYESEQIKYDVGMASWKQSAKSGRDSDPPQRPVPPAARRIIVSDITVEAIAPILRDNPRGMLLARDELGAFIGGFDQYKGGRSDAQAWLEFHRGAPHTIDRKVGQNRTIHIPRGVVSIVGTTQPGTLAAMMTPAHFESGLAARLLLVRPPVIPKKWSDKSPSPAATGMYEHVLRELLDLQHRDGSDPIVLPFSAEALPIWAEWHDQHAERTHTAESDRERAALAKIEAYCLRLALIFELLENPAATAVSVDALRRGAGLADWFANEATRVYAELEADRPGGGDLIAYIRSRGGRITPRELARNLRRFGGNVCKAELALDELVQSGTGSWEQVQTGGRPSSVFVCADGPRADESPNGAAEKQAFVGAGFVGGPEAAAGDAGGQSTDVYNGG